MVSNASPLFLPPAKPPPLPAGPRACQPPAGSGRPNPAGAVRPRPRPPSPSCRPSPRPGDACPRHPYPKRLHTAGAIAPRPRRRFVVTHPVSTAPGFFWHRRPRGVAEGEGAGIASLSRSAKKNGAFPKGTKYISRMSFFPDGDFFLLAADFLFRSRFVVMPSSDGVQQLRCK